MTPANFETLCKRAAWTLCIVSLILTVIYY